MAPSQKGSSHSKPNKVAVATSRGEKEMNLAVCQTGSEPRENRSSSIMVKLTSNGSSWALAASQVMGTTAKHWAVKGNKPS